MKKLLSILLLMSFLPSFAVDYNGLNSFKQPAYRLGTTDEVEIPSNFNKETVEDKTAKEISPFDNIEKLTYADLSIKKISKEISQELNIDYENMSTDLSILWQGAASKSDTIKFALYKLSNPDKDKPDDKSIKKVLQSIANMSTLVGAGTGNALFAASTFLGGNVLGIFAQDDKALNYKYTKVNDADMIILVRKIEDLQQNVVNRYYDYVTARKYLEMTTEMARQKHQNYQFSQNGKRELILITDAYYRESLDLQRKAQADFLSKSAALEQLVGYDAFKQFESNYKKN